MTRSQPVVARTSHIFAASAERVYDAWLDPRTAGKWLFATPTGQMMRVEIDARVGGSFTITERRDGEDVEHVGAYVELTRPRRIVFLLRVPKFSQQADRVVVDIVPLDSGCEVTITHELAAAAVAAPDNAQNVKNAERGWSGVLRGLANMLGE
jgi:uncharacterized protein YndB with AHSA1/START domain